LEDLQSSYIYIGCYGAPFQVSAGEVLASPFQASSFNITDLNHYELSVTNVVMMTAEDTKISAKISFTSIALTSLLKRKYFLLLRNIKNLL